MEIDQIGDVDPLVAVVHAAQVGLAHVFQLIQVEIIAPQFRTVHFPAENVVIFFVDQTLDLDFALVDLRLVDAHFLNELLQCGGGFLRTGDFAAFLADLGRQYAALDMACSAAAVLAASQAFDQPVYGLDLILFGDERLPARRAGQRVEDRAEDAAIEHDVGIHFLRFVFVYGRCGKAVLDHVERDVFDRVADTVAGEAVADEDHPDDFGDVDLIEQLVRRGEVILPVDRIVVPVEYVVQVVAVPRYDLDDVLVGRVSLERSLEVRSVAAGGFLLPLAVGVDVKQKVLRIVHARDAALVLRVVAGAQHDVDAVRHRDVAHAADGAARVAVVDVAVGAAFEKELVVFDVIRIEIRRAREVAHLGADAVQVAVGILELVEHVSGDHLDRTDALEVVAQPFQYESRDHFALAYPAVAVDFDHEYATVVLLDQKQRAVTRDTADLLHLFVDDRQARFFYVAEIVGFLFQRSDDRLDIARRTLDVEIAYLRERNQLFGRSEQRDHVRDEIHDVLQADILGVVEPVVVGQVLQVSLLENDQLLDDTVLDDLATVVVRVHVPDEARQPVREERRVGARIDVADILGRMVVRRQRLCPTAFGPVDLMERVFALLRIGHDPRVLLYGLLGTDHAAFAHQFVDPGNAAAFECLECLVLHSESFVERYAVLHHFVDARVLFLERRLDDADHRVRVTVVIVGSARALDHADVEPDHAPRDGIYLALGDLDVLLAHDVVAQLLELHREDFRNEFLGEHPQFGIVATLDLLVEVLQLLADQLVERVVVVEQVQIQDLVRDFR